MLNVKFNVRKFTDFKANERIKLSLEQASNMDNFCFNVSNI
jgi:hypothetical protein